MRNSPFCIVCALTVCLATQAYAQSEPTLELTTDRAREYGLPAGFDPSAAIVATRGADTVLAATIGVERAASCVVLVVAGGEASALTYRHEARPTACANVSLGEPGEVFLRGVDPTIMNPQVPSGFTARLDADASLRWAVNDSALVDEAPSSEGGTGEFIGLYGGVSPLMAYQPEQRVLMAFSVGSLQLGLRATQVTQAHLVDADTGRVVRSGQGFGSNGAGFVSRALPDAQGFLLSTRTSSGSAFFRYNGRTSIQQFEPLEADWSQRTVFGFERNVTTAQTGLLWSDDIGRVTLSVFAGDNVPLYETEVPNTLVDATGEEVALGEPLALYMGTTYTAVQYLIGTARYVRVFDATTGELFGGFYPDLLTQVSQVIGIIKDEEDELRLLSWNRSSARAEEYRWVITPEEQPVMSGDMGEEVDMSPDMTSVDMGPPAELGGSEFCAVGARSKPAQGAGLVWLAACVMGGLWRRRRTSRV